MPPTATFSSQYSVQNGQSFCVSFDGIFVLLSYVINIFDNFIYILNSAKMSS